MLSKTSRLSRKEFLLAKSHGTNHRFPHFSVIINKNNLNIVRVSVVTSTKFHKRAVVRNRFRRLVYSYIENQTGSYDLILFPKNSMLKLTHEETNTVLSQVLSSLSLAS